MSDVFGALYAEGYDSVYEAKDYRAECDLLERLWAAEDAVVKTVLDLGCGTGGHALELAGRGYEVTGVDRSPEMIAIAERKKDQARAAVTYAISDLAELRLDRTFEAAVMMFNVIGYLEGGDQRRAALQRVRDHLGPGRPFVFDFWFGPAVLEDPPIETFREIPLGDDRLLRASSTRYDAGAQLCDITIDVQRMSGDHLVQRTSERHRVSFYFVDELTDLLRDCGLELTKVSRFSDPAELPSTDEWTALGMAKAF